MTRTSTPLAPRLQDRGVARKQAFLQAAREVFLEQGYEAASVNDVVRRAGGSLSTLYAQYGNKEGLFQAVLVDQHERFTNALIVDGLESMSLEAALQKIGEQFVRTMMARDNLAFFRLIVGEGRKFPEPLQRYISSGGADKVLTAISGVLQAHGIDLPAPEHAASYLVGLWRARHHYRALGDEAYTLSDQETRSHVEISVRIFLEGVRTRT